MNTGQRYGVAQARVRVRHLWKVFGKNPRQILDSEWRNQARAEVLEATDHVFAVRDVNLDVHESETFVVMGLSGSGKSTLVRCLTRLIEPTEGTIEISGQDVRAMSEKSLNRFRYRVGMVFQHFGLLPHRKVLDNATWGMEVQKKPRSEREVRAREVLDLVGLDGWEDYYPSELSGGMQQRVGLARALAVEPDILLMDEPFSALDPVIRRELQDELADLQTRLHKTIIFITHDLNEAMKIGDRIAIMKDGEIVQVGTPQEILDHPANDYVREFTKDISERPDIASEKSAPANGAVAESEADVLREPHAGVPPVVQVADGQPLASVVEIVRGGQLEAALAVNSHNQLLGLIHVYPHGPVAGSANTVTLSSDSTVEAATRQLSRDGEMVSILDPASNRIVAELRPLQAEEGVSA